MNTKWVKFIINVQKQMYYECRRTKYISSTLFSEMSAIHQKHATERKRVLKVIIDVVQFIRKRGIAFRSLREWKCPKLNRSEIDHENFLETVQLLLKYEPVLQRHINVITKHVDHQYNTNYL